jgi:gas vesicle protein
MGKSDGNGAGGKMAGAALVAGVVGAAAGVLMAPKSGKETRADIKRESKKAKDNAQKQYHQARQKASQKSDELKQKAADKTQELASKGNDAAQRRAESVKPHHTER